MKTRWATLLFAVLVCLQIPRQGGCQNDHSDHKARSSDDIRQTLSQMQADVRRIAQAVDGKPKQEPPRQDAGYWKQAFGPANAANWALVVVGGIAGYLAYRTLRAIDKQASLQFVALKQWLDVRVGRVEDMGGLQDPDTGDRQPSPDIEIWLTLSNRTPFPLTLDGIVFTVSADTREQWTYESDRGRRLTPGGRRSGSIAYIVHFKLGPDAMESYRQGTLFFAVAGTAIFTPSIGPAEPQEFGMLAKVGDLKTAEMPYTRRITLTRHQHHRKKEEPKSLPLS